MGYWLLNCDDECINGANATGFVFLALGAGLYFPMTVNKISMKTFGRDIWESKNKKKRENNNKDDLLAAELAEDWFQGLSKGGGLYVGYWLQNWLKPWNQSSANSAASNPHIIINLCLNLGTNPQPILQPVTHI